MPVDWKAPDSFHRLLAATVASMDGHMKLNYKRIADYYGQGATYDAIEGRFRIIKKQAADLREEVENGRPVAPERGTSNSSKDTTPRKPRAQKQTSSPNGVMNGRVTKPSNSPSKKANSRVKAERLELSTSASSSSYTDEATTPASSTNNGPGIILGDSFDYGSTLASFDLGHSNGVSSNNIGDIAFTSPDPQLDFSSFWDNEVV